MVDAEQSHGRIVEACGPSETRRLPSRRARGASDRHVRLRRGGPHGPPRVPRDDAARGLPLRRRHRALSRTVDARRTSCARCAQEMAGWLAREGVKLIVVACNSATATALRELQRTLDVPVIGVLTPEARAAVQLTRNRRVGLLATEATIASGRYRDRRARPRRRHRAGRGGLPGPGRRDPARRDLRRDHGGARAAPTARRCARPRSTP